MMNTKHNKYISVVVILLFTIVLCSCQLSSNPTVIVEDTLAPASTSTKIPPTVTPIPLAAQVNGESILLSDYLSEILRLQDAQEKLGTQSTTEEQQATVLTDMVNQSLLAQAAKEGGYSITDDEFTTYLQNLITESGGEEIFTEWLSTNHYDKESFTRLLKISLAAAWQREQIVQSVPLEAEQVSVMQILVFDETLAENIYSQLENGTNFELLAFMYEPDSGGWLGWFPKGYLLLQEIEDAAFSLQPGEYSGVIETSYGYHILYQIERDPQRPLSTSALEKLQKNALKEWLENARAQADIEIITE